VYEKVDELYKIMTKLFAGSHEYIVENAEYKRLVEECTSILLDDAAINEYESDAWEEHHKKNPNDFYTYFMRNMYTYYACDTVDNSLMVQTDDYTDDNDYVDASGYDSW